MATTNRPVTDVIILGAGASKSAGCPLLNDFMDRVESIFWERGENGLKTVSDFETVLGLVHYLRSIYMNTGLNVLNIEELYGLVETDELIGVLSQVQNKSGGKVFDNLKKSLDVVITETIQRTSYFAYQRGGATNTSMGASAIFAHDSYRKFAAGVQRGMDAGHRYAILTFNYDLEVEVSLAELGIRFIYALDGQLADGVPINLLKLHGSLNWFPSKNQGKVPYVVHIPDVLKREVHAYNRGEVNRTENPRVILDCLNHLDDSYATDHALSVLEPDSQIPKNYSPPAPIIVPPLLNKGKQQASVSGVWQAAAMALSKAKRIHITGYSFPPSDNFFRYLFGLGMLKSDTFLSELHVYDPNKSTRDRFAAMLGRGLDGRFHTHEVYFHNPDDSTGDNSAIGKIFPAVYPPRTTSVPTKTIR